MALPAVLARVVVAALKRWAPKYVGSALAALGVIEAADIARATWRAIFGDKHEEAAHGAAHPEEAPPELVEYLRAHQEQLEQRELDVIDEEEVLHDLERSQRRDPAADVSIQLVGRSRC